MTQFINPHQQKLIVEKLYRSTDSITSLDKFNEQYEGKIGRLGERTLTLGDFARLMKQTAFSDYDIERFTKEITGLDLDLADY